MLVVPFRCIFFSRVRKVDIMPGKNARAVSGFNKERFSGAAQ